MILAQGTTYRARLDLPFLATEAMAIERLEGAGFTAVQVYHAGGVRYVQGGGGRGRVGSSTCRAN